MKFFRLFLVAVALVIAGAGHAQELKVTSFQRLDRDLLARTQQRLDLNDVPCAVLRVSVANVKSFGFEGNIIGDIVYKQGEAIIYLTSGSRNITIQSDKFGTLRYEFNEQLEKQVVYKLSMKLEQDEAKKIRTLVMPVATIGTPVSYGLMLGVVRKVGFFLKAKSNFKSIATTRECTSAGSDPSTGNKYWMTGNAKYSRLAITGGLMFRLISPLYLYAGGGYGYRDVAWEMYDHNWAKNLDESYRGAEADLGLIFRMKNFAISAGAQSNSFKYFEGNVGIGIMF